MREIDDPRHTENDRQPAAMMNSDDALASPFNA